jgi:hypothetical protein
VKRLPAFGRAGLPEISTNADNAGGSATDHASPASIADSTLNRPD